MNFLLFFFLCSVLSLGYSKKYTFSLRPSVKFPEPELTKVLNAIKLCITRTGISQDIVMLMRAGIYTEDRQFQEFIHCAFKESGYVTDDGHVLIEKILKLFPKDLNVELEEVLHECHKKNGSDVAETTFKYFSCFQDKSPVRIQLS